MIEIQNIVTWWIDFASSHNGFQIYRMEILGQSGPIYPRFYCNWTEQKLTGIFIGCSQWVIAFSKNNGNLIVQPWIIIVPLFVVDWTPLSTRRVRLLTTASYLFSSGIAYNTCVVSLQFIVIVVKNNLVRKICKCFNTQGETTERFHAFWYFQRVITHDSMKSWQVQSQKLRRILPEYGHCNVSSFALWYLQRVIAQDSMKSWQV